MAAPRHASPVAPLCRRGSFFQRISLVLLGMAWLPCLAGTLLVHETFPYPDGPLVQVASQAWSHYSGTSNQLLVAQGRARLSETLTEDVQVFLPGRPYTNSALYVRFIVNYSRLPSGGGGCFALLKDAGVNNNRACLYATTLNSPPGSYRLGLRLTGVTSPLYAQYHPQACATQAEQVVVLRYQVHPPAATLWINPASEADPGLEVSPDGTAPLAIHAFALRQSLASGNGMGDLTLDGLRVGLAFADVATPGAPPTLSAIPDLQLPAGGVSPPLPLILTDEDTPLPFIFLYGQCEPPELIPPDGFIFSGTGGERSLMLHAADGRQGLARVTITALDDTGLSAQQAFTVRLGAPTCQPLTNYILRMNQTLTDIPLVLGDAEQDSLTVSLSASDRGLFPATNLLVSGAGYERWLTLRPAADRAGHAVMTLVVDDGHLTTTHTFQVTVAPHPGRLLTEEFDYPDGILIDVGAARWAPHSGQAGQALVAGGALLLSETNSEDVSASLGPAAMVSGSGYVLYARVDFRVLGSPTNNTPAYWAHYKDGGNGFRCRLFVSTNQAPPGEVRLGISSAAALPTAELPQPLALHTPYTVVTRFNLNNGESVLWLNPAAETDPATVAGDHAGTSTVLAWAFRQASGMGVLSIERMWVGTAFEDVVPPQPRLSLTRAGRHLILRWPDEGAWRLESAEGLSSPVWTPMEVSPAILSGWCVWTNDARDATRFFRLRR